ncbi:hypothetical protein SBD_3631 [Streptomyces bottropensis ATCC 25435]|uniref:Uncharacterized protein n=1 Tax=Streptomyces bottropensis ATCC 25435 TaxID=1054862 RepID=M3FPB8_9ACTN|nr:hypothetical protein SBD_3631 [Streptomyces bottropensis ATCC 25435]
MGSGSSAGAGGSWLVARWFVAGRAVPRAPLAAWVAPGVF